MGSKELSNIVFERLTLLRKERQWISGNLKILKEVASDTKI